MKLRNYIPGYRSNKGTNKIIASIYYFIMIRQLFILREDIYIPAFICVMSIPFAVFGIIDILKKRYKSSIKIEFLVCILPISLVIISLLLILNDGVYKSSLNYQIASLNNNLLELEEESQNIKEAKKVLNKIDIVGNLADNELKDLKENNQHLRTEIDDYKKEIELAQIEEKQSSNNSTTSNNSNSSNNSSNIYNSNNNSNYNGKHIGKYVYVANGNRYYHAISNCSYLEGASTSRVVLTSDMDKFECNCWTNPVVYKPPSQSNSNNSSSSSGGRTVYIASGNSYYHKSPSCKFLRGASTSAVSINNVGGKHPCNCIKY